MTDKEQIMINGVDVSGCEYLTYELEEDGEYYWFCKISPTGGPDECEYNPECFYKRVLKQLARKTQEAEKYKKLAADFKDVNKQLGYKYLTIKKECEELKKELNGSEKWRIKAESLNEKLDLKNTRYLKALEEIKEIAEPFCNACQEFEPEKNGSNCMYCNYGKILQKISECEVNND